VGSVQNFYTSRDNNTDPDTYVGQLDRLWYNPDLNSIYVSDGNTAGGIPVALATGANITANIITVNTVTSASGDVNVTGNLAVTGNIAVTGHVSSNPIYGCLHKRANVVANVANTVANFDWYANTHVHPESNGVTVSAGEPTRVVVSTAGDYQVSVEMQTKNVDNAERTAYIWLAQDGTDLEDTSIRIGLRPAGGGVPTYTSVFNSWTVTNLSANSYIELRYAVDNTSGISLEYTAGISSPYVRPNTPSATITVVPV
jgi:hypothetical protein